MKILIVEDNVPEQFILKEAFKEVGATHGCGALSGHDVYSSPWRKPKCAVKTLVQIDPSSQQADFNAAPVQLAADHTRRCRSRIFCSPLLSGRVSVMTVHFLFADLHSPVSFSASSLRRL